MLNVVGVETPRGVSTSSYCLAILSPLPLLDTIQHINLTSTQPQRNNGETKERQKEVIII